VRIKKKGTCQHGGLRAGSGQQFSVSSPAKRKKSPVSLADIEAILEIIEESWTTHSKDFGDKTPVHSGAFLGKILTIAG